MIKTPTISLARISVRGVVQGVGFRPFVYQLATSGNLKGWVCNTSGDVSIEVEGDAGEIESFVRALHEQAPPLARIEDITVESASPAGYNIFEIRQSAPGEGRYQLISPDIATCPECRCEIFDPADRRYRYPFTNCTNCGPRFTIIEDIPYDRPLTTMKAFQMCPDCQREYENPSDRRFHAQPNACPVCGPQLSLLDSGGRAVEYDDILVKTSEFLKAGKIVAVKGLGGFQLACDATDEKAVDLLRQRKNRPGKPFAVMVASLEEAGKHVELSQAEAELLASPGSPIVLAHWKNGSTIDRSVAPGLNYLGLMLPYTPLHHLLLNEVGIPLVMTSGNLSEEPIARDNDEALCRLGSIADCFLVHNRDIYARYDDSVMTVEQDAPRFVRRARGYAPYPVHLSQKGPSVLGCGAEEKNTFCLTRDDYAFVSQHIGDMENLETLEHFINTIELYKNLFRIRPEIVACDMHPDYLATKYAGELAERENLPLVTVQHHHAHIASCLADNRIEGPVIGVSFDGTGYGSDGHIWGGEFLVADCKNFQRAAHLEYMPLPGGATAVKRPYRTAIGYLSSLGIEYDISLPCFSDIDDEETEIIRRQVENNLNSPLTSSMGRLYDAVAAIIGVRGVIQYEAQAAIELETLATLAPNETGSYSFDVSEVNSVRVIRVGELLTAIIKDFLQNTTVPVIAARFHNTVTRMIINLCKEISRTTGLKDIALSGGVFQNRLLTSRAIAGLEVSGFNVFRHRQVPCNDGGISLGQVVIAQHRQE